MSRYNTIEARDSYSPNASRSPVYGDQNLNSRNFSPLLEGNALDQDPFDRLPSKVTRLDRENHPYNENPSNIRKNPSSTTSQKRSVSGTGTRGQIKRAQSSGTGSRRTKSVVSKKTAKPRTPPASSKPSQLQYNDDQEYLSEARDSNDLSYEDDNTHSYSGSKKKSASTRQSSQSSSRKRGQQPAAPHFVSEEEKQELIQKRIQQSMRKSAKMSVYRLMQRRLLKEDYELSREQQRQEEIALKQKRIQKWKAKTKKSPFSVDLVADSERVEEENRIKSLLSKRQRQLELKRLEQLKQNLIMNALIEEQNQLHQRTMRQQKFNSQDMYNDQVYERLSNDAYPNEIQNDYEGNDDYNSNIYNSNNNNENYKNNEYNKFNEDNDYQGNIQYDDSDYFENDQLRKDSGKKSSNGGKYSGANAPYNVEPESEEDLYEEPTQESQDQKRKSRYDDEHLEYIDSEEFYSEYTDSDIQSKHATDSIQQQQGNLKSLEEMRRDALRRFSEQY